MCRFRLPDHDSVQPATKLFNLVHLVSEQALQNLLPLLALRPACVIQIRSADERFARAALVLGRTDNANKLADLVAFARALRMAIYVGNPAEAPPRLADPNLPDYLRWAEAPPPSL